MLPAGKAGFKAFFTKDKLIDPENINYQNEEAINRVINEFLKKIEKLPKEDWTEEIQEYVVVEKEE
jgi:spore coat protein CotH